MYKCDFLRQNNIQYKGQRFYKESVLDMRTHFKPTETFQYTFFTSSKAKPWDCLEQIPQLKHLKRTLLNLKTTLWREAIHKILWITHSQKWSFKKGHKPSSNETKQKTNLALRNTIPPSSSKSQRNLNEEEVPNTAKTIAKPNFPGAAHNIIQKKTLC